MQSVDLNPGPGRINVSTAGLDTRTQTDLEGWVWTLVGGYAAIQEPRASLDVLGGFRYLNLDAKASWQLNTTVTGTGPGGATATFAQQGSAAKSEDLWAAIVGAKGRAKLGASEWFVNYYTDIGGGSSAFTLAGGGGHWVRLQMGRHRLRLPLPVLQPERRQVSRSEQTSVSGALGAAEH